jgi:hypothetical protein
MNTVSTNQNTLERLRNGQGNMHFKTHEQKPYKSGKCILAAFVKASLF